LHIFQALNILKQGIFSMTGIKLDGKEIAQSVKERVKKAIITFTLLLTNKV